MPTISWDVSCPSARLATVTQAAPTNGPFGPAFGISFSGNAIGASPIAWTSAVSTQTPNLGLMGVAVNNPLIGDWFVGPMVLAWSTKIIEDEIVPNKWASNSYYDIKPPSSRYANTRWDTLVPTKSNDNSVRWDIVAPVVLKSSSRQDMIYPQSRSSVVSQDSKPPIMWTVNLVNVSYDTLSPISWGASVRSDTIAPAARGYSLQWDVLTLHQILNSQKRDVITPLSASALTMSDNIVPDSWIAGLIRDDISPPVYWLSTGRLDYSSPIQWGSQLIQVAWDSQTPVSWSGGIRSDVVAAISYASSVRLDLVDPTSYLSSIPSDMLSLISLLAGSKGDALIPEGWGVSVRSDNAVLLSWAGSTFPISADDYSVPIAWGATVQADVIVPDAWAGGVNPIQGDWLSPIAWRTAQAWDVKPPVASGVKIIRDVLVPVTWRLSMAWASLVPQAWRGNISEDVLVRSERRAGERLDYVSPVSWAGVTVNTAYDVSVPIAWWSRSVVDVAPPLSSSGAIRRDILSQIKTVTPFIQDFVVPDAWADRTFGDVLATISSSTSIRTDYLVRLGWTTLVYNVSSDINVPLSWGAVWNLDLLVPAVSSSSPVRLDVVAAIGIGSGVVEDTSIPMASSLGATYDVNVPNAWGALSGIAVYYDTSSPISWGQVTAYDDPVPVGYSVALTENALVPVLWDGKPFTPDPGRTVYGPAGVRIAIP